VFNTLSGTKHALLQLAHLVDVPLRDAHGEGVVVDHVGELLVHVVHDDHRQAAVQDRVLRSPREPIPCVPCTLR